ncbi:MAG TPA: NRDE family protein [Streptosporangiaceae bacterium]|nr:NRDE family protein [Streptosporangiaceae bacterium]
MCLLIALFQVVDEAPLIVAANRDELFTRPAVTMTVLRDRDPRVLGGRDELAGGTWLAVNEHGVVAGLTNQPAPHGRDASKRSRGELPLAFAACRSAADAVRDVVPELDPANYNPCWMLVGDRESLFSVGLASGRQPAVTQLGPGRHVLENRPFGTPTAKTAQVTAMVAQVAGAGGPAAAADALAGVLSDHRPAVDSPPASSSPPAPPPPAAPPAPGATGRVRPPELSAACVHTPTYGTRSAMIITVSADGPPRLRVADGPPCEVPFRDATGLWAAASADRDPARR